MKDLMQQADEMPVTLVVAIAYGTLAVVTNVFAPPEQFIEKLVRFGMLSPAAVTAGEPWRLLTYAFLHGGIVHLLVNTMTLFSIAPMLERSLGSLRFAALYVVSAIGGGLMVCLTRPLGEPVVGGSGALFGMFGAALALMMRSGRHLFASFEFEGPRRLLGLVIANLVIGWWLPMISNAGHVGGLLAGFAFALLWLDPGRRRGPLLPAWRAASLVLFASALFASLFPVTREDFLDAARKQATGNRAQQLSRALFEVRRRG